jgi:hypothetical protein
MVAVLLRIAMEGCISWTIGRTLGLASDTERSTLFRLRPL